MTDTVETADGRSIPVTSDPDQARGYATGLTVSLRRKISTAKYESAEPHASLRVEVSPALDIEADGAIDALRAQAERMKRVVAWQVSQETKRFRGDTGGER